MLTRGPDGPPPPLLSLACDWLPSIELFGCVLCHPRHGTLVDLEKVLNHMEHPHAAHHWKEGNEVVANLCWSNLDQQPISNEGSSRS